MFRESRVARIVLSFFFLLLIGYALYEARGVLIGPAIELPAEAMTVTEPFVHIRGTAERITELKLNGKQIPVTESGEFDEPFLLAEGSNWLLLEAKDARGRTTEKKLTIIYRSAPPAAVE